MKKTLRCLGYSLGSIFIVIGAGGLFGLFLGVAADIFRWWTK